MDSLYGWLAGCHNCISWLLPSLARSRLSIWVVAGCQLPGMADGQGTTSSYCTTAGQFRAFGSGNVTEVLESPGTGRRQSSACRPAASVEHRPYGEGGRWLREFAPDCCSLQTGERWCSAPLGTGQPLSSKQGAASRSQKESSMSQKTGQRRQHTAAEKVSILRSHLLEGRPVSDVSASSSG